jgi:hypothetical protein
VTTLVVGRTILGFASGVMAVAVSKCLYETVPESLSGTFGTLTNMYACLAGMIEALLG